MSITKISPSVVDFDAGITISTTDNTSNLILTSTDADANIGPVLELYRNSSSPADNDELARIYFYGENDNDEKIEYALIKSNIVDASDGAEGSSLQIYTYSTGGQRNRIDLLEGETVFNEGSQDIDFRVESDNQTHGLFINGADGNVGIGNTSLGTGTGQMSIRIGGSGLINAHSGSASSGQVIGFSQNAQYDTDGSWEAISTDAATNYYQGGGAHIFRSAAATTGGTDISWTTIGQLNINGLCFGTDTAAANALDDYEYGTYNPTYTGASAAGSQGYSVQNGYYVKVGSLITVFFDFTVSSSSSMSGAPYVALPFPSVNQNWYAPFVPWEVSTAFTDSDQKAAGYVAPNSSVMVMHKYTAGNSLIESGYLNINTTGRISGQVTYQAA